MVWYEKDLELSEIDQQNSQEIIDNNDYVDVPQIGDSMGSLSKLKQKVTKTQDKVAGVGEYVLLLKGKPVLIGAKDTIKDSLEELLQTVDVEKLSDDDVIVFYRVDLETLWD